MSLDEPVIMLSFIAGPAIITNACAILQNGAAIRYSLAVPQWREFHTSIVARDRRLEALYTDPVQAVKLAERRIRLQLRQTRLLLLAACLFACTSLLALVSTVSTHADMEVAAHATAYATVATASIGLLLLGAATATFFLESHCTGRMIALHTPLAAFPASDPVAVS